MGLTWEEAETAALNRQEIFYSINKFQRQPTPRNHTVGLHDFLLILIAADLLMLTFMLELTTNSLQIDNIFSHGICGLGYQENIISLASTHKNSR